jgi:transcriptional regulator GlxA family with amidase domain
VGVNGRKLERLFRRDVGLSPKLLARIVRFQNVIATVERNARRDWAALALDCGYYDQAHLINDFRRFAGMSPVRYFATEHPMADFFSGVGFFQSGADDAR